MIILCSRFAVRVLGKGLTLDMSRHSTAHLLRRKQFLTFRERPDGLLQQARAVVSSGPISTATQNAMHRLAADIAFSKSKSRVGTLPTSVMGWFSSLDKRRSLRL